MIRPLGFALALLLLGSAGCAGLGEKEAQLEFERLRQRAVPPQRDRVKPDFGTEPSGEQVFRRCVERIDPHPRAS